MAELDPDLARATARSALTFAQGFDGRRIDWQGDSTTHIRNLGGALDYVTELAAMVLNLSDRVAPPGVPASPAPSIVEEALRNALEWHRGDKWRSSGSEVERGAWELQRDRLEEAVAALGVLASDGGQKP